MVRPRRSRRPGLPAFDAAVLRVVSKPPSPLPRAVLGTMLALLCAAAAWLFLGRLDIVAVADGRLVPRTLLKVVQPAEAGVVREILVDDGAHVLADQPLLRLDSALADADWRAAAYELRLRELQRRRIDAELSGTALRRDPGDDDEGFRHALAQHAANCAAYADAMAQEDAAVRRLARELEAARAVLAKLDRVAPMARSFADRYARLASEGFVSEMAALDRSREAIEKEHERLAQQHTVDALVAGLAQAERHRAQVASAWRQQLHAERAQADAAIGRARENVTKELYRRERVELRAPVAGIVKDLATHTIGSVVAPGTVLLTLVPHAEELQAEVAIRNEDAGFVRAGQRVRVKLAAYPFQKYGLLDGEVLRIAADASDESRAATAASASESARGLPPYRARIALDAQRLAHDAVVLPLAAGMAVAAEIHLGERSLIEYLLAPVQKAWHEAARER